MTLPLLPASLPGWAKIALPLAIIVLPGGSLIPVLWFAFARLREVRVQRAMLAPEVVVRRDASAGAAQRIEAGMSTDRSGRVQGLISEAAPSGI